MSHFFAQCDCGELSITIEGKPRFVNACACRKCQRQGSGPLGIGVFFKKEDIKSQQGTGKVYSRTTDKGNKAERHFCSICGSAVFWTTAAVPDCVGVSWGALEEPEKLKPNWLVWARSLPEWLDVKDIKHFQTQPD